MLLDSKTKIQSRGYREMGQNLYLHHSMENLGEYPGEGTGMNYSLGAVGKNRWSLD